MVKPDLGTLFFRQKWKSTPVCYLNTSPMRQHQTILMLAQWQLHTVSLETCKNGQGLKLIDYDSRATKR